MSRSSRALAALSVLALLAAAGCSDEGDGDAVAATVNGIEISSQDVVDELEAIRGNDAYLELVQQGDPASVVGPEDDTYSSAFVAQQLAVRIQYALVEAEVQARDLEIDDACLATGESFFVERFSGASPTGEQLDGQAILDAFPDGYRSYLVRREAEVIALQGDLAGYPCNAADDDEVLQNYFDEHPDEFPPRRCVAVIQADTQEEIDAIAAQLAAGAAFEDVLTATSGLTLDQAVECIGEDNLAGLVPEALTLEEGQITAPTILPSQAGDLYLIARLEEIQLPTFETSREAIVTAIDDQLNGAFNDWYTTTLADADVTVDPRFGTWNPDGAQGPTIDRPTPAGDTTSSTEPEAELVPED